MPPEMVEGMQRWQEACTPGEQHAELAKYIGTWTTSTRMLMTIPGAPAAEPETGTATFAWLIEGRWVSQRLTSTMMGQPYEGFGIMGYDNFKQRTVGCWVDSMSTVLLTFTGRYNPELGVTLEWGPMDEPMTGEHDKLVRYETRWIDDDTFTFAIHDLDLGPEKSRVLEITYSRQP
jgi:hypothetical protein